MKFKDWLENKNLLENQANPETIRRLVYSYASRKPGSSPYYAPGLVSPLLGQVLFKNIKPAEFDVTPIKQWLSDAGKPEPLMAEISLPLQLPSVDGKPIGIRTEVYSKSIIRSIRQNLDEISKKIRHQGQTQPNPQLFDLVPEGGSTADYERAKNFTQALAIVVLWANNISHQYEYDLLNPDVMGLNETNGHLHINVRYNPLKSSTST